jgi:hypothetical protein
MAAMTIPRGVFGRLQGQILSVAQGAGHNLIVEMSEKADARSFLVCGEGRGLIEIGEANRSPTCIVGGRPASQSQRPNSQDAPLDAALVGPERRRRQGRRRFWITIR